MHYRLSLDTRVRRRVAKIRSIFYAETQRIRRILIVQLQDLFRIASSYARGKVEHVTDEKGKERLLTIAEKQFYARIAAYAAQIVNDLAKGIDERQIDKDLDTLEAMLKKTAAQADAGTSGSDAGEPPRKLGGGAPE